VTGDAFLDRLIATLAADPLVEGLVLCGSSAQRARRDAYSDHDWLLVTASGTQETYRTDLSWLPDHDHLLLAFRETAHGLKGLYRSGLVVEFAVFDRAEFDGCVLNHYEVVIDRGGIAQAAERIAARSLAPRPTDPLIELRHVLALIVIADGRARRGERLSAGVFLRAYAAEHLLRLARLFLPDGPLDALDPWRRVERADPTLARILDDALARPVDEAGLALLEVLTTWLPAHWPDFPRTEVDAVRAMLERPAP
jgi:hypothetical protein